MKRTLFFVTLLVYNFVNAQFLNWPSSPLEINTGNNHTILVMLDNDITLNESLIENGALLGVFYNVGDNDLQCAGVVEYVQGETFQLIAYGDDATTPEVDGYLTGDEFQWYVNYNGIDYQAIATYNTNLPFGPGVYQTDQIANVTDLQLVVVEIDNEGCTDPNYIEYDETATLDDGSCQTLVIEGCTDPESINFNLEANVDDGSCEAVIEGCTDSDAFNFNPDANTDDGSCSTLVIYGCTVETAINYNPEATANDGSCILEINGCTDPLYIEYNETATIDDGSCAVLIIEGCTNPDYTEFYPPANTDNGSCETLIDGGCTDSNYMEFNPEATLNDGSCLTLIIFGCLEDTYIEYNVNANTDDGSCETTVVYGCTDVLADNYNLLANLDDTSCFYLGCTDIEAYNYDETATEDDGSCVAVVEGCTNPDYLEFNPNANTNDGSCYTVIINGCTDAEAFNYDELANIDDGSCEPVIEGCTNSNFVEFNPIANIEDGSCTTPVIFGCTDVDAANYQIEANTDNGSCVYYLINLTYEQVSPAIYEFEVEVVYLENYVLLWDFGDGTYSTSESNFHIYNLNGEYTITVSVSNGELSLIDEVTITIDVPGLSIDEREFENELLNTSYFDLLGKPVIIPSKNKVYIKVDQYKSGKMIRSKHYYTDN